MAQLTRALLVTTALVLGCDRTGCGEPSQVPFKRGDGVAAKPSPVPEAAPSAEAAPQLLPSTHDYPEATSHILLAGFPLARGEGSFRSVLSVDLNADLKLDALLLVTDGNGRPALTTLVHGDRGFTSQPELPIAPQAAACRTGQATLTTLGPRLALATVELTCGQEATPARHTLAVTLEPASRVLLHAELAEPSALGLAYAAVDRDADEHTDLQLTCTLTDEASQLQTRAALHFLNRPSGLALERGEPEATIAGLASQALPLLGQRPEQALSLAQRALAIHGALCREGGSPQLTLDGQPGIACGVSAGAGKAVAASAIALAKLGRALDAIVAGDSLQSGAYRVNDALLERAAKAIAQLPGDTSYVWRVGPPFAPADAPEPRPPALHFTDETHLLLRGTFPQRYDLTAGTVTETTAPAAEPPPASAVATSQGVVLLGDSPQQAVLVRKPPSCEARASDAARSPSGAALAMLCGGHVYVATREPAPAAEPRDAGTPAPPVTALPPPSPEPQAP